MPYKDPEKAREYIREYMHKYRVKNKSKIPSGFKTREEYNTYMRIYNRQRREKFKAMKVQELINKSNRLAFLEWENQRLNRSLEVALNR